jgi:hypothetical protein
VVGSLREFALRGLQSQSARLLVAFRTFALHPIEIAYDCEAVKTCWCDDERKGPRCGGCRSKGLQSLQKLYNCRKRARRQLHSKEFQKIKVRHASWRLQVVMRAQRSLPIRFQIAY